MKKVFIIGISFIIAILAGISISNAANIGASGETVTTYAGETITLKFTTSGVSNSNQLGAIEAKLGNLPNGISVTSMTCNLSGANVQNNIISWYAQGETGNTSNVTITLKLGISNSMATGSYSIPIAFDSLMDFEGNDYGKAVTGTIKVVSKPNTNTNTNTNTNANTNTSGNNSGSGNTAPVKSSDASIKSLTAVGNGANLKISRDSNKYTTTVEADVNKVTLTVVTGSTVATIDTNVTTSGVKLSLNSSTSGKKVYTISDLKDSGNSVARITIKAEDGTKKDYTFVVTRKVLENRNDIIIPNVIDPEQPEDNKPNEEQPGEGSDISTDELGLKNLIITGVEISPKFDISTYEYTATIEGTETVEVIALPTIEDATVEIVGNTNLVEGENLITILVKKDDEIKTYQIILTKTTAKAISSVMDNIMPDGFNFTWKHIAIIAVAVIIAVIVIIKLISMSKKHIDENGFIEEDNSKKNPKGRRYK